MAPEGGREREIRGYAENVVTDPTRKFLLIASSCKVASCLQRRTTVGDSADCSHWAQESIDKAARLAFRQMATAWAGSIPFPKR
jgi:hypothetical protein